MVGRCVLQLSLSFPRLRSADNKEQVVRQSCQKHSIYKNEIHTKALQRPPATQSGLKRNVNTKLNNHRKCSKTQTEQYKSSLEHKIIHSHHFIVVILSSFVTVTLTAVEIEAEAWLCNTTFIETPEATSIYKQGKGSSLNIKSFGTKMTKELREGINSQGLDQQWQVLFFYTKNNL